MKKFLLIFIIQISGVFCFAQNSQSTSSKIDTSSFVFDKDNDFVGGQTAWRKFVVQNLNATVGLENGAPDGTYIVSIGFLINENGIASDYIPETKKGYGMEAECMQLLLKVEKWQPATKDGKPVKSYRHQKITFFIGKP